MDVPGPIRTVIIGRLQRTSEFFSAVVCRWILTDVAVLLDKHGALMLSFVRELTVSDTDWNFPSDGLQLNARVPLL